MNIKMLQPFSEESRRLIDWVEEGARGKGLFCTLARRLTMIKELLSRSYNRPVIFFLAPTLLLTCLKPSQH